MSDSSFEELHQFARALGIPRVAFQGDHYDLHEGGREAALARGATATSSRDLVRALNHAGLRRGPGIARAGLDGVAGYPAPEVVTDRLILRQWTRADVEPLLAIESEPAVMSLRGASVSQVSVANWVDANAVTLAVRGFGQWAVERRDTGELIGRAGVSVADSRLHFSPALELGVLLSSGHWHSGFGAEASTAALRYGFQVLEVDRIVACAPVANTRARRTLQCLGFIEDHEFEHLLYEAPHHIQIAAWVRRLPGQ